MAQDLVKIGVLGVEGDDPITSHIRGQWAGLLNPPKDAPRKTGMTITHVWDKDRPIAEEFAWQHGIPHVVDNYGDMAGQVDGVIQSGLRGSPWGPDLVRPYLEARTAVFMDRPGAYSLARARELVETAEKHGALLYVTNNHENCRMVETMRRRTLHLGSLTGLMADSLTDRYRKWFAWHCIHGWHMVYPILAGKVRTVRTYVAGDDPMSSMTVMNCRNEDGSPFLATLGRQGPIHRGWIKLFGAEETLEETMLPPITYRRRPGPMSAAERAEHREYLLAEFSIPSMHALERMIRSRKAPQTGQQLLEKMQVFLAMFQSLTEGGRPIDLADMDPSWTAPYPFDGYFPEGYFSTGWGGRQRRRSPSYVWTTASTAMTCPTVGSQPKSARS